MIVNRPKGKITEAKTLTIKLLRSFSTFMRKEALRSHYTYKNIEEFIFHIENCHKDQTDRAIYLKCMKHNFVKNSYRNKPASSHLLYAFYK